MAVGVNQSPLPLENKLTKEGITQDEFFALKLLEQMAQNNVLPNKMFQSIIEDYKGKIDFKEFSCYNDSKNNKCRISKGVYL